MDWSLFGCARTGHVTYAPDEPELRDRLMAPTAGGTAWRCLRCGAFVTGGPHGSGPAAAAPLIRRGRELRSELILRVFAVERFLRFLILGGAAYGVWRFRYDRAGIQRAYNNALPAIRALYRDLGFNVSHSKLLPLIQHSFTLSPRWLTLLAIGLAVYALIELAESAGLWLGQRWGEYFALVATSIFLPWEIHELTGRSPGCGSRRSRSTCCSSSTWPGPSGYSASAAARTPTKPGCAPSPSSRWNRPRSPRHRPASPVIASPPARRSSRPAMRRSTALVPAGAISPRLTPPHSSDST